MFESINDQTPEHKKAPLPGGHDDSGYDGLGASAGKMLDQGEGGKKTFSAEKVRSLLESCSTFSNSHDKFLVTAANIMMLVVVFAGVCSIIMMGESSDNYPTAKLGGKRAAIQYYYDSVYGAEDTF